AGKFMTSALDATSEFRAFPTTCGAEFTSVGEVRFRVWAPGQQGVTLRLCTSETPTRRRYDAGFGIRATGGPDRAAYAYVPSVGTPIPDPASRCQKDEVNGPSLVIDPTSYEWLHAAWQGRPWEEAVIYEMHVGTFTEAGTFRSAIDKLPHLVELGITAVE